MPTAAPAPAYEHRRPAKRLRTEPAAAPAARRPHPLAIRPLGNALGLPASETTGRRAAGLGVLSRVSDEVLVEILPRIAQFSGRVSHPSDPATGAAVCLARLGQTSRVCAVVTAQSRLWKELFAWAAAVTPGHHTNPHDGPSRSLLRAWLGSWRASYVGQFVLASDAGAIDRCLLRHRREAAAAAAVAAAAAEQQESDPAAVPHPSWHYYSDQLYEPYNLSTLSFARWFPYVSEYTEGRRAGPFRSKQMQRRLAHTPVARVTMLETQAGGTPGARGEGVTASTAMAAADFFRAYCLTNTPAVIDASGVQDPSGAGPNGEYACMTWTLDKLADEFSTGADGKQALYAAESFSCTLPVYRDYARSCGAFDRVFTDDDDQQPQPAAGTPWWDPRSVADESPMYLFDATFADHPQARRDWRVPAYLGQVPAGVLSPPGTDQQQQQDDDGDAARRETKADLFRLLGGYRPDFRWIIAGPRRSGSGWHKDPNMTSAWNTVLGGSKLWLMLPPECPPPGVYVTADEAEVTAPLSLAEWVHGFYDETKRLHGPRSMGGDGRLLEAVCARGETVYVPSGWWHAVINLDECVALTQNFVSAGPVLASVLRFMATRWDQLSGFKGCEDHDGVDGADVVPTPTGTHEGEGPEKWSAPTVFDQFCARLRAFDPDMLEAALREPKAAGARGAHAAGGRSGAVHVHRHTPAAAVEDERPGTALASLVADEELEMPW